MLLICCILISVGLFTQRHQRWGGNLRNKHSCCSRRPWLSDSASQLSSSSYGPYDFSSVMAPEPWWWGHRGIPSRDEHSVSYSQHIGQLGISVLSCLLVGVGGRASFSEQGWEEPRSQIWWVLLENIIQCLGKNCLLSTFNMVATC